MTDSDTPKSKGLPKWMRWAISLTIIAALVTHAELQKIAATLMAAKPGWLLLGILMIFLEQVVVCIAWNGMIATRDKRTPLMKMLQIVFVSNYIGFIFPSSAGPDFVKILGLSKYIGSKSEALSSLFIFRLIGYVVLFTIAFFSAVMFSDLLPDTPMMSAITKGLVTGFLAGVIAILFAKSVMRLAKGITDRFGYQNFYAKLESLYEALKHYIGNIDSLIPAVLGALLVQINRILIVYVMSLALRIDVDPITLCVFVPIITAITLIPVSISGIGVREGGYVLLFGHVGMSADQAISLSLCVFGIGIALVVFGGIIYMLFGFPEQEGLEKLKQSQLE